MVRERHGRRCYDWKYWPALVVVLAMTIAALSAKIAWGLETYWTLPPGSCQGHDCRVPVEGDLLAMDAFRNCLVLYEDAEKVIVVACVEPVNIAAFLAETEGRPLTSETATEMHLGAYFLGKEFAEIFVRYPDLAGGYHVINEDGTESEIPYVKNLHFGDCE
jgi:hypothetical protein